MSLAQALEESQDESAALYRLIADSIPHIVWAARADGSLDFVNRRCDEYTGLAASELTGWAWRSVVHAEDYERALAAWTRSLQSGERFEVEYRLRRADGAYRWHQAVALPMRDASGRIVRWFGTCTDIELQMQSARILEAMVEERTRELRENERRFQRFMEHLPGIAWIRDARLRYSFVNRRYAQERGRQPAAFIGEPASRVFPPEMAERFEASDREVQRTGLPVQYVDNDPAGHWLKTKFPLPDPAGGVGVAGIALDVTERVRLEEALAGSERRTRALVARLIDARESERRQLADELHDLIGQNLTALGIDLMALKPRLEAAGDAAGMARLEAMRALVESTISSIRGVMTALRPPGLEEFGLPAALRAYTDEFSARTGITVRVELGAAEPRLWRDAELALFRIVQEALTNVAKHSGATSVRILLARAGGHMRLAVEDDGRGMPEPHGLRARGSGWGLPEMRERAEAHGGSLRIEQPLRGIRIVAEMPLVRVS